MTHPPPTQPASAPEPDIAALVGHPDLVLVVSDLHLGDGQDPDTERYHNRENFFADRAFSALLEHHDPRSRSGTALLVINGDAFDFLRITNIPVTDADFEQWSDTLKQLGVHRPPDELRPLLPREVRYGLRTNDYKSVWKLRCIARGHPRFFAALGRWLEWGGRIVFVKGNHDLELYWPLVQQAIRSEIGHAHPPARVGFERVLFCQECFQLGNLYIEHGHRFEATTAVKGAPTLPRTPSELNLPLGSFVNRYIINRLEGLEPFLDNIKPVQNLLWTLLRRHPGQVFSIARHAIPFLRRAARPYWLRDGLGFGLYFLSILVQLITIAGVALLILWPEYRRIVTVSLPNASYAIAGLGLFGPYLIGFIRDLLPRRRPKAGEDAFGDGIYGTISALGVRVDYPRLYGVVGHTHVPDVQRLPHIGGVEVLYVNSGTWIPVWDVNRPDLTGRVVHTFIRFTKQPAGWYGHEHLEWHEQTCTSSESVIFARGLK